MANDCQRGDFMFWSWLVFKTSSEMPAVRSGGYICIMHIELHYAEERGSSDHGS
jgi:hypothetical protein